MKPNLLAGVLRLTCTAVMLGLGACGSLLPTPPPPPTMHLLTWAPMPQAVPTTSPVPGQASLRINAPLAAAGFDSRRLIYLREPYRLDYFAKHEWADTPARMLAPLLLAAFDAGGRFRVVTGANSAASAEFSIDTEIIRLQQDFSQSPSQAQLTLRASLLDNATRRVLASREFDARVAAPSEDAAGGVKAVNLALKQVLKDLVEAPEFAPLRASLP
ncbi:ABC-type transport auxiliary lipoprotein family protein [Paucibacter sp. B2R-40]|uniref:ABC-type transport auxiliary lipoprotein family protein n=1 Tax=Paucibacter sp. B2R-40 TaxID=2893554 RepID=UPI0021E3EEB4|nr:ABC-type transport auxiliary lipoprotein family protein [Paucibacter sp. B2R-40]MCV2356473.1 ABC-type transport auxiliary lipoprotein family protein [Paucibacter sp. B2R-40]